MLRRENTTFVQKFALVCIMNFVAEKAFDWWLFPCLFVVSFCSFPFSMCFQAFLLLISLPLRSFLIHLDDVCGYRRLVDQSHFQDSFLEGFHWLSELSPRRIQYSFSTNRSLVSLCLEESAAIVYLLPISAPVGVGAPESSIASAKKVSLSAQDSSVLLRYCLALTNLPYLPPLLQTLTSWDPWQPPKFL